MKITFDQNNTNQNVDRATTAYRDTRAEKTAHTGGFALDISGTVMDNKAYEGHGRTAEEVMQEAGLIDVATQRDYMTVMSNTMSKEDFSRLQKEGYHPGDMEIEEVVTIVDKIKAEVLKGGTQVVGYTDSLDAEKLKEITGSESFAQELYKQFTEHDIPVTEENVRDAVQAYGKAAGIAKPEDGTIKYMVENRMEPTIDNLYRAGYSSGTDKNKQSHGYYEEDHTGYYAKKAEEYNWQKLLPQMEKIIEQAGLSVDEENIGNAKWLVEAGVPLTPDALTRLYELKQLELPQNEQQILSAAAAAISDGKGAAEANLADPRSNLEKAADYEEAFAKVSDAAVDKAAAEEKAVTLRTLKKAQAELAQEEQRQGQNGKETFLRQNEIEGLTPKQIQARRQLEEIRLMMTTEVNRKLIESGFSIDTAELEKLVEALKELEAGQNQILWGETEAAAASEKSALLRETYGKVSQIPSLPAAVLGRFLSESPFTLDSVHANGTALKASYDAAKESYETLMTAPRADMGDSIGKAFRNVDDILKDIGLETSEENRRAVRILGYNSMDITTDNIDAVKKYDMELRETIRKMTPAATLQAIRDGQNPLTMSIDELNAYLNGTAQEEARKEEKFSKYLYKLDKNHAISPEEREAYIGIYRMFRQLEKTEDAAVGSLLKEGSEFSFQNLLTAMRSTKKQKQGMDYTVDDRFAGVDSVRMNRSITDQIMGGYEGYYSTLAVEIADTMEPEVLAQMDLYPDMTMEEFAEQLLKGEADAQMEDAYVQEQIQQYQEFHDIENRIIKELLDYKQPVTAYNLMAAKQLREEGVSLYKKLKDLDKSADSRKTSDVSDKMIENLTDKEKAAEAFDEMQQVFYDIIEEAKEDSRITYLDLKSLQSMKKQLALAGNLAKEENYQIPVEINGELTAINLKVLHGADCGKISVAMQTESYGKMAAQFSVKDDRISGIIACESEKGVEAIQQKEADLRNNFVKAGSGGSKNFEVGYLGIIQKKEANVERYTEEDLGTNARIQTADLYQLAKTFITTITA